MTSFLLKLTITPALIGLASLVGRRWGAQISGWLIGLPFTSGPVTFFLALGHGNSFAAAAASGTLTGVASEVAFCLSFAWGGWLLTGVRDMRHLRRLGWLLALLGGLAGFALATFVLQGISAPLWAYVALAVVSLGAGLLLMPRARKPSAIGHAKGPTAPALPWWDLPARMGLATIFVVALTAIAPALGPRLTGLLAPFPLYASILAAFAYQQQGANAALGVLRGLVLGLFGFAACFLILATLLVPLGIALSFALATLAALFMQGVTLLLMRRPVVWGADWR